MVGVRSRSKPSSVHHVATRRLHALDGLERVDVVGGRERAVPLGVRPRERFEVGCGDVAARDARDQRDVVADGDVDHREERPDHGVVGERGRVRGLDRVTE